MFDLSGVANIKCSKCNNAFDVDGSDIYIDAVGSDERSMGSETYYAGNSEFICPQCKNNIEIEYEASEYPIGALNYSEVNISGAEIIRGFHDIDVSFAEEMYSFDEKIELYLPEKKAIITNLNYGVSDLILEVSRRPDLLYDITAREFEELIANVFSRYGFSVELTKQTRDGGRDIIAIRSDLGINSKYIIECKRYSRRNPVRVDLVRNLYGVQAQEGANKSVLATTSFFTPDAKKFAETLNTTQWAMDLKGYEDIVKWVVDANHS